MGAGGEYYEHVAVTPAGSNTWEVTVPSEVTVTPPPVPPLQYSPVGVTASGEHTAAGGAATNAVDGDLNTWWDSAIDISGGHAGQVPAWIQLELADVEDVASMDVHFYDNDGRQYTYGVEDSTDGTDWTQIVPAGSTVVGLATHEFDPPVGLRYVRITVTANTRNDWAHIKEIRLYGSSSEEPPEPETFYLQAVGAGASDLYGNPGVALYVPQQVTAVDGVPDTQSSPLHRAAPVAAAGAAASAGLGGLVWLLVRKLLLP